MLTKCQNQLLNPAKKKKEKWGMYTNNQLASFSFAFIYNCDLFQHLLYTKHSLAECPLFRDCMLQWTGEQLMGAARSLWLASPLISSWWPHWTFLCSYSCSSWSGEIRGSGTLLPVCEILTHPPYPSIHHFWSGKYTSILMAASLTLTVNM